MDNYFHAEDLQVYDFTSLEGQDDLGALLDEQMNDLNDETFGAFDDDVVGTAPVGRDFDFAGTTSRYLGNEPPAQAQQQSVRQPSPWSSLDADPLLSGRSPYPSARSPAQQPMQQPMQLPQRAMRTLDDIEAELRSQARSHTPSAPAPGRPLTLEEVEAEMLSRARAPPPQQQQQPQQPPRQQQLPPPGFPASSPLPAFMAPPNQPFPQFPPPGHPGFPPPHLQQHPHHLQQQQQQRPQSVGPPGGAQAFPPGMMPPRGPGGPGMPPGMGMGMMPGMMVGPGGMGGPNMGPVPGGMMNTLFPALPSQPQRPVSVEQQLQYLSLNQHAQHPSLTGVQLQALLQQAQIQAAEASVADSETDADKEDRVDKERQAAAGEELIRSVERRIREHEMMEHKRKRKAQKIASFAKHNNLMSNSDKDFITRIQVSQLVTDDPYADDFYFHIMAALRARNQPNFGMPPGGPGPGPGGPMLNNQQGGPQQQQQQQRGRNQRPSRRDNAMNKMAQNVQRLVDSAKQRNKASQLSLDGALGKIALRTRSAPRQLLQVSSSTPSSGHHALLAGLNTAGASSAPASDAGDAQKPPLAHRAILAIVEQIYDAVLDLEQMRRGQPALLSQLAGAKEYGPEGSPMIEKAEQDVAEWDAKYAELAATLWKTLRVMEPLNSSNPHPFISLLSVLKGKRILPRAMRHLSPEQTLTLVTLVIATFDTLDTVRDAPLLDDASTLEGKQRRAAVETKTEVFLNAIISPFMAVIGTAPLRMVTGMLGLLLARNDIQKVVKAKPGLAFLTILLSRAESLKQATPPPEAQDLAQWQQVFTQFFHALSSDLPGLFPSTRAVSALPFGPGYYLSAQGGQSINTLRPDIDREDEPVWRFLAAVAVGADPQEQQTLVTSVRDKVLENVTSAKKGRLEPEVASLKIRNVDLLLHSLGLDSSQLTVE